MFPESGGSPPAPHPYTLAGLARWLGATLTSLGYRHVDILGISWGGELAQQFAVQNPRRCRRLVLVSTATGTLMIPAAPHVLATLLTQPHYRDPDFAAAVAEICTADHYAPIPAKRGRSSSTRRSQTAALGTRISCWPGPAG